MPAARLAVTFLLAGLPGLAQFQSIEISFQGIGCASCLESLPARVARLRGVESARVDAERGLLQVQLAAQNRVRLEQVRDLVEQDGTKAQRAQVRVQGELAQVEGKWLLQAAGVGAVYEVRGQPPASPAGAVVVTGESADLHPEGARIAIQAREVKPARAP